MLSDALNKSLARRGVHYGWIVAGVTFLTMLCTAGAVGAPGVFITPLQKEFGWSTADISAALAIRLALFGLMGPFAAVILNRFGLRRVVMCALGLVASALVASLFMRELWHLVVLWGFVIGLGTGLMATVLGATVVTRWFSESRGLVMGFLAASTATGQLVFLPLLASLTDTHGWRFSLAFIVSLLIVAAIAVLALMRDRPRDMGLAPYGAKEMAPPPAPNGSLLDLLRTPIVVLFDAARTPAFWVLFATFFVCGASTNGLIQTHFIPMCGDNGLIAVKAAGVLALIGVFDFVGTVASGWLSDRYDSRLLLFWYYGLRGVSLLMLPFMDFTLVGLSLFAVFYGLDWIATVPPTVKITADRFGPERANVVFGWIFAGHQLGAASIAYAAGASRTLLYTYTPAFIAAGLLCFGAAMLVLTLNRTRLRPAVAV